MHLHPRPGLLPDLSGARNLEASLEQTMLAQAGAGFERRWRGGQLRAGRPPRSQAGRLRYRPDKPVLAGLPPEAGGKAWRLAPAERPPHSSLRPLAFAVLLAALHFPPS
jgi:hypothetical protein